MGLKERRKKIVSQIQALAQQYPADKARNELVLISMAVEDELMKIHHRSQVIEQMKERIVEKTDVLT